MVDTHSSIGGPFLRYPIWVRIRGATFHMDKFQVETYHFKDDDGDSSDKWTPMGVSKNHPEISALMIHITNHSKGVLIWGGQVILSSPQNAEGLGSAYYLVT